VNRLKERHGPRIQVRGERGGQTPSSNLTVCPPGAPEVGSQIAVTVILVDALPGIIKAIRMKTCGMRVHSGRPSDHEPDTGCALQRRRHCRVAGNVRGVPRLRQPHPSPCSSKGLTRRLCGFVRPADVLWDTEFRVLADYDNYAALVALWAE
jgi:hypothetical protein